jgi:hypothetical protein
MDCCPASKPVVRVGEEGGTSKMTSQGAARDSDAVHAKSIEALGGRRPWKCGL